MLAKELRPERVSGLTRHVVNGGIAALVPYDHLPRFRQAEGRRAVGGVGDTQVLRAFEATRAYRVRGGQRGHDRAGNDIPDLRPVPPDNDEPLPVRGPQGRLLREVDGPRLPAGLDVPKIHPPVPTPD